jgi:hypothetical protein
MLGRVLEAIRGAGRPMCLADLSRELDIDGSALEGMLGTLVARGRLLTVGPADTPCGACPIRSGCFIMADGVALTYALPAWNSPGPTALSGQTVLAGQLAL